MITLIKNNQHYSHNYVTMKYNKFCELTSIVKSAAHKTGIKSINSEVCGMDWYAERCCKPLLYNVYRVSDRYINLSINALNIKEIPEKCSYSNYKKLIPVVIKHYCNVWNKEGHSQTLNALHGDLSLVGNVLFIDSDTPVFIDWEHFKDNAAPVGFDALNCILELLYYEDLDDLDLLHSNLEHVSKMIHFLNQHKCLDKIFHRSPLLKITEFMRTNSDLWGGQVFKFPVLKFSKDKVSYIDDHLNQICKIKNLT